ncbi:MAG: hypothetical protein IJS40_02310 [Synergistaceae bacterium]|nr:hypothetical protein [Synergistaceae bacterium]
MSLGALLFIKYAKKHNLNMKSASAVKIEMLSSLHLTGRDIFFVVRCGPDVIAFVLSQGGACLMGRWSYEEWNKTTPETETQN